MRIHLVLLQPPPQGLRPHQSGQGQSDLFHSTQKGFKERQKKPHFFTVTVESRKTGEDVHSGMDIAITVPKELFGQTVGAVRFRIREDNVPSRILVKKAIFFGDMRGMLHSRRATGGNRLAAGGPLQEMTGPGPRLSAASKSQP